MMDHFEKFGPWMQLLNSRLALNVTLKAQNIHKGVLASMVGGEWSGKSQPLHAR